MSLSGGRLSTRILRPKAGGQGGRYSNSADVTAPLYSSSVVEEATPTVIEVTFSEPVNSPALGYDAGVTIEVNSVGATISGAVRQANQAVVFYTIDTTVFSGDTVTFAYTAASGDIEDQAETPNALADVSAKTVTNNVVTEAPSLLLDTYTGAAAAYSLRKLRTAYAGSAVRIRESGGDTELDVGFDGNGDFDTAAAEAHCGANNGFIVKWYDQSGNAEDWAQSTAADQPQIVSSGSVITRNSKPAVQLNTSDGMSVTRNGAASSTIFAVAELLAAKASFCALVGGDVNSKYLHAADDGSVSETLQNGAGTPTYYHNGTLFEGTTRDDIHTASSGQKVISILTADLSAWTEFRSSYWSNEYLTYWWNYQQERILYDSDKTSDRSGIETEMNTYYSVF